MTPIGSTNMVSHRTLVGPRVAKEIPLSQPALSVNRNGGPNPSPEMSGVEKGELH